MCTANAGLKCPSAHSYTESYWTEVEQQRFRLRRAIREIVEVVCVSLQELKELEDLVMDGLSEVKLPGWLTRI